MELADLLRELGQKLDQLGVPYLVTGSMASIAYGEPRFTNDIDVVTTLSADQVPALCEAFGAPDYFCSADAAQQAARERFQFNIIHPASGLKIDVIVAGDGEFDRSRFARARRLPVGADFEMNFAAPEDVIVKKLEYFREGRSDKHLRDIVGILKVQGERIDRAYLAEWVARLGLNAEWKLVEEQRKG